ncbi:hypothetical protein AB0H92_12180 [Streptomyces phaeochromogenes]|uniref:hypothetical protein n=1 Tax=Streptomyces phaeochromogenes TaxID=1923 RepID=UPI0033C0EB59
MRFIQPSRYDVVDDDDAVAEQAVRLPAELHSVTGTSSGAWKSSRLQGGPAVI